MKVAIHGASGRMGQHVARSALCDKDIELVAAIDHARSPSLGKDIGLLVGLEPCGVSISAEVAQGVEEAEIVIDFSLPPALPALIQACQLHGTPLVSGTTGADAAIADQLTALQKDAAVFTAANFSLGVNVLIHLAATATRALGETFDAELIEMHHRNKVDAPSGTALALADAVRDAKSFPKSAFVYGREGKTGARSDAEIGVMTLRGGDVVGEHTLILAGESERLELTHRASDRSLFAKGALRAAKWLWGKPPGRYTMNDVLGL